MKLDNLSDEELAQALVCCSDDSVGACRRCPVNANFGTGVFCFNAIRLAAARRLRNGGGEDA